MKLLLHLLTSLHGPKRRFAAPQRYVSNWGYSGPAWCMLETDSVDLSRTLLVAK